MGYLICDLSISIFISSLNKTNVLLILLFLFPFFEKIQSKVMKIYAQSGKYHTIVGIRNS